MDVLTSKQRHYCMSRIKGIDTEPELQLRRALHGLGCRYRLHDSALPGRPDLVFPARHKVIFVHGCFWHRHKCPLGRPRPTTRPGFWEGKFKANKARDKRVERELKCLGWAALVVWECETARLNSVLHSVVSFLDAG